MHVSKDSMWRGIWKILQNFSETKQGLTPRIQNKQIFNAGDDVVLLLLATWASGRLHNGYGEGAAYCKAVYKGNPIWLR